MKTVFVIFSGFNNRAVVTLCRLFKKHQQACYIIALSTEDPILLTAFRKQVKHIRTSKKLELPNVQNILQKLANIEPNTQLVICPTSEFLNNFLLRNRPQIESDIIKIPLVEKAIYDTVSNKSTFTDYCDKFGVKIPQELHNPSSQNPPFVAKPKENIIAGRTLYPFLIFDEKEKSAFLETENPSNYFYQEFIKGQSYYLFFYVNQNGKVYRFSQKNLAQQPEGKSIIFAESCTLHRAPIAQKFEEILQAMSFAGLVMIEIIQREKDYYLIEANPRFWGPYRLVAEGFPAFVEAFLEDYGNHQIQSQDEKPIKYLWLGGFVQKKKKGTKIKWYFPEPFSQIWFLLKNLKYDVYFKRDTIKVFFQELGTRNK